MDRYNEVLNIVRESHIDADDLLCAISSYAGLQFFTEDFLEFMKSEFGEEEDCEEEILFPIVGGVYIDNETEMGLVVCLEEDESPYVVALECYDKDNTECSHYMGTRYVVDAEDLEFVSMYDTVLSSEKSVEGGIYYDTDKKQKVVSIDNEETELVTVVSLEDYDNYKRGVLSYCNIMGYCYVASFSSLVFTGELRKKIGEQDD